MVSFEGFALPTSHGSLSLVHSTFRVVPIRDYLKNFSSDRSHMVSSRVPAPPSREVDRKAWAPSPAARFPYDGSRRI